MPRKIIAFIICFCLIFEQAGFAQVAPQLGVPAYLQNLAPVADKFRPVHLRSLSFDQSTNNFNLLLDKGDTKQLQKPQIEETTKKLLEYFKIGLTLPNSMFWVNLRPDAPTDIIDPYVEQTDLGKVLLEADLQLKKDMAQFTSPKTPEGKQYWDKLYQKAESLYGSQDMEIPTLTRPWIVPGEIIIGEAKDSAYVYKATLKVMLEQDYLKDTTFYSFDDDRAKQLNEYSSQILREIIIPKLTREVNASKRYASLRQVYYSLVLAQWFKQRHSPSLRGVPQSGTTKQSLSQTIDTKDLTGLTSKTSWSKETYYKAYKKSFSQGEYNKQETIYSPYGETIRSYFSGGLHLGVQSRASGGNVMLTTNVPPLTGPFQVRVAADGEIIIEGGREIDSLLKEAVAYAGKKGNRSDVFMNEREESPSDPKLIVARYFYENISAEKIFEELQAAGVEISDKGKFIEDLKAAGFKRLNERRDMPHVGEEAAFTGFIIGVSPMGYLVEFLTKFKYTGEERMISFSYPALGGGYLKIIVPASVLAKRNAWLNGVRDAERVGKWVYRKDGDTIRIVDYHPLPSLTFDSPYMVWDEKVDGKYVNRREGSLMKLEPVLDKLFNPLGIENIDWRKYKEDMPAIRQKEIFDLKNQDYIPEELMINLTAEIDGRKYVVYSDALAAELKALQKRSEEDGARGVPGERGEIDDHSHFIGSDFEGPSPTEAGAEKLSSVYIPTRPGDMIFYGLAEDMRKGMRYMVYSEELGSRIENPLDNPKIRVLLKTIVQEKDDLQALRHRDDGENAEQRDGGTSDLITKIVLALAQYGIIKKSWTIEYLKRVSLDRSRNQKIRQDSMYVIASAAASPGGSASARHLAQKALLDIVEHDSDLEIPDFFLLVGLKSIANNHDINFYRQLVQTDIDALFNIYKTQSNNHDLICPIADIIANAIISGSGLSLDKHPQLIADDPVYDDGKPEENLDTYISVKKHLQERGISIEYVLLVDIFKDGAYSDEIKVLNDAITKGLVTKKLVYDFLRLLKTTHQYRPAGKIKMVRLLNEAILFAEPADRPQETFDRLMRMLKTAIAEANLHPVQSSSVRDAFNDFFEIFGPGDEHSNPPAQAFRQDHPKETLDLLETIIVNCPEDASGSMRMVGDELFRRYAYWRTNSGLLNDLVVEIARNAKGDALGIFIRMEELITQWLNLFPEDKQEALIKGLSSLLINLTRNWKGDKGAVIRYVDIVLNMNRKVTDENLGEVSKQIQDMFLAEMPMSERIAIFFKLIANANYDSIDIFEPSLKAVLSIDLASGIPALAQKWAVMKKEREQLNPNPKIALFQKTIVRTLSNIEDKQLAAALNLDILIVKLFKQMPDKFQGILGMEGPPGFTTEVIEILRSDKNTNDQFALLLLQYILEKPGMVDVVGEFIAATSESRGEKPGAYQLMRHIYNSELTDEGFRIKLIKNSPPRYIARLLGVNIKLAQYIKDRADTNFFNEILEKMAANKDIYNEIAYNLNREITLHPSERRLGEDEKTRLFDLLFKLRDKESLFRAKEMFDEYFRNDPDATPLSVADLKKLLAVLRIDEIDGLIKSIRENPKQSLDEIIEAVEKAIPNAFDRREIIWILSNLFVIQDRVEKIKPLARLFGSDAGTNRLIALLEEISKKKKLTELRNIADKNGADLLDVLSFRLETASQDEKEKLLSEFFRDIDSLKDDLQKEALFDMLSIQFDCQPLPSKIRIYMRMLLLIKSKDFDWVYSMFKKPHGNEDIGDKTENLPFTIKFLSDKRACIENNNLLLSLFELAHSQINAVSRQKIINGLRDLYISRKVTTLDLGPDSDAQQLGADSAGIIAALADQLQLPQRKSQLPHIYFEPLLLIYSNVLARGPLRENDKLVIDLLRELVSDINMSPELRRMTATLKNELHDKIMLFINTPHREMVFFRIVEITAKELISSGTDSSRIVRFHKELTRNLERYAKVLEKYYATHGREGWKHVNPKEQQMADMSRDILNKLSKERVFAKELPELLNMLADSEASMLIDQFSAKIKAGIEGQEDALAEQFKQYAQTPQAKRTDHKGGTIFSQVSFFLKTIAGVSEDVDENKTIEIKQIYQNIFDALLAEIQGRFKSWRYAGNGYTATIDEGIRSEISKLSDTQQKAFWAAVDRSPEGTLYEKLQAIQGFEPIKESIGRIKKGWEQDLRYSSHEDIKGQQKEVSIVFTDDFITSFNSGNRDTMSYGGTEACQNCMYSNDLNRGLTGYVVNGRNKVIAVLDEKGRVVTRRIVRLAVLKSGTGIENLAIFVEESTQFGSIGIDKLYGLLDIVSKQTGLPVVASDHRVANTDELKNLDRQSFKIFLPYDDNRSEIEYSDAYGFNAPGHKTAGLYRLERPQQTEAGSISAGVTISIPGLMMQRPANELPISEIEKKYDLQADSSGKKATVESEQRDGGSQYFNFYQAVNQGFQVFAMDGTGHLDKWFAPNEEPDNQLIRDAMRGKKGIYLGVAYNGVNLSRASHANFDKVIILDFNPFVAEVYMPLRFALISRSRNRAEYLGMLSSTHFSEEEIKSLSNASLEAIEKVLEEKLTTQTPETREAVMNRTWEKIQAEFPMELQEKAKEVWLQYSNDPQTGIPSNNPFKVYQQIRAMKAEASWLSSEERFTTIRVMAEKDKILGITGNWADTNFFKEHLADNVKKINAPVSLVYISNIIEWWGTEFEKNMRALLQNIASLPLDKDAILLFNKKGRTVMLEGINQLDSDAFYEAFVRAYKTEGRRSPPERFASADDDAVLLDGGAIKIGKAEYEYNKVAVYAENERWISNVEAFEGFDRRYLIVIDSGLSLDHFRDERIFLNNLVKIGILSEQERGLFDLGKKPKHKELPLKELETISSVAAENFHVIVMRDRTGSPDSQRPCYKFLVFAQTGELHFVDVSENLTTNIEQLKRLRDWELAFRSKDDQRVEGNDERRRQPHIIFSRPDKGYPISKKTLIKILWGTVEAKRKKMQELSQQPTSTQSSLLDFKDGGSERDQLNKDLVRYGALQAYRVSADGQCTEVFNSNESSMRITKYQLPEPVAAREALKWDFKEGDDVGKRISVQIEMSSGRALRNSISTSAQWVRSSDKTVVVLILSSEIGNAPEILNTILRLTRADVKEAPAESLKKTGAHKDGGLQEKGGIDFRAVPISTTPADAARAADSFHISIAVDPKLIVELEKEWQTIQQQMQKGPMPYAKMKEYAASCKEKGATAQMDAMFACLANILRLEEDAAVSTPAELKEILTTIG